MGWSSKVHFLIPPVNRGSYLTQSWDCQGFDTEIPHPTGKPAIDFFVLESYLLSKNREDQDRSGVEWEKSGHEIYV